ncbi:Crp/Fnr family transcriptional regulator [Aquimarina litoralis]|uniref:Crp/Fnr family transcriptional regulator n=1 Tax=Aquimarina litoralis TaxID=584605 RepID=UPI001C5985A9|nr:hypothetical protein [Aquimarina litoralis]MBW1296216.1 hypothetical protein [Aquimarina litoralis]
MIENLKQKIEATITVSDELWNVIRNEWKEIHVKKGDKLVGYGELNTKVFFVLSGSLEISLILNDGSSKSVWFYLDELFNVATTQDSAFLGVPTKYEITVLEDSVLLQSDCHVLDKTAEKFPELYKFKADGVLQDSILMNEIRNHIITLKPLDFVQYLYDNFPIFVERIPAKNIANFMGITPEWYSKLQKKLRLESIHENY